MQHRTDWAGGDRLYDLNEPFNLARQLMAIDVMSRGRASWNAITSAGNDVAANYGVRIDRTPFDKSVTFHT